MNGGPVWPLGVYVLAVLGVVGGMVGISYLLGERHRERATGEPYESGVVTTGTARVRFSAHFYLVAMFFVIFDLEAVFLFAWAVAVPELGWLGYVEILIFVAVLLAAWAYLWRVGALDWGPSYRRRPPELRVRPSGRPTTGANGRPSMAPAAPGASGGAP